MYMEHLLDELQGNDYGYDAFTKKWMKLVNIIGTILTCAVASHVFGSGISMLDKFLKIVFAMKPDARLERKTAVVLLVFSWSISATFAVLPVFGIGEMTYTDWFDSISLPVDGRSIDDEGRWKHTVGFAAGSQIALVILQLTSFLLYVPIFIVAKKSAANVGMKRETAIARKIALLICTNIIFFTAPVVIGVFQGAVLMNLLNDTNDDWRSRTLAKVQWTLFFFKSFQFCALASTLSSIPSSTPWDTQTSSSNSIRYSAAVGPPHASVSELSGRISGATQGMRSRLTPARWKCRRGESPRMHLSPKKGTMKFKVKPIPPKCPAYANELLATNRGVRMQDCRLAAIWRK